MELRIYSPTMDLLGIIENQTSLLWHRAYSSSGTFEAHFPLTEDNTNLLKLGNLITYRGAGEAGVIEDMRLSMSSDTHEISVSGRFLTSYLDRRIIHGTLNFSGTIENAMRRLITDMVAIPQLELGSSNGFIERVEFQATYKNILSYETKLAEAGAYGYRIRPDFTAKKMFFEVYKGENHSIAQNDRNHVEFSERYNNIERVEYTENNQLYSNVAYVLGEGEGSARKLVITGDNSLTGLERRELYVDARDLQSDKLTESEYLAVLKTRGDEKLNEAVFARYMECEVIPVGNFEYKRDYTLGDIVTVQLKKYGLRQDLRISELTEIYEDGRMNVQPTFGTPLPIKIDWSDEV